MEQTAQQTASQDRVVVAFRAAGQDYCVDITAVREIRMVTPATALPHAPPHVRGVINLRGQVVPILDLARRLDLPEAELGGHRVIVIVALEERLMGLLVEGLPEILSLSREAIRPAPEFDNARSLVRAVIKLDGHLLRYLDVADLFAERHATA